MEEGWVGGRVRQKEFAMNIITYKPNEINIHELAVFIAQARSSVLDRRGMSLEDLEDNLQNEWPFIGYVLARLEGEIIGYALLYQIGDSDLIEINPGALLGHHPITAPGFDERSIGSAMIEAAKKYVVEAGFDALYIDIPWNPNAPAESYTLYRERYGALGFEVIQQMLQMNISLPVEVSQVALPADMQLAQIQSVDAEVLYQCHHQAYLSGNAQYYFQMDEVERRDDFERIYAPNIREHPASLALIQNRYILGYCLLFGQTGFSELISLAVHPDHRRRGYGRLLMNECLKRAGEEGHQDMRLIVDVKNESAAALYRQCGFEEVGGNMTFKWKSY
jgi:ribosomal protein S18 acetylase RimI-like enzyme